jgi:hypothetical protein
MTRLAELEGDFARAVLDVGAAVPTPLARKVGGAPSRRFDVYRNNVYASLIDVLASRFPMVARLVGDEFFRTMARVYVEREPPRSPVLLRYGAGFADFVTDFPPAAPVPYLADVARLEWAWHAAYHAPDATPLTLAELADAVHVAEHTPLALHPSLHVVRSPYPVVTIWQLAAQKGEDEPTRCRGAPSAGRRRGVCPRIAERCAASRSCGRGNACCAGVRPRVQSCRSVRGRRHRRRRREHLKT